MQESTNNKESNKEYETKKKLTELRDKCKDLESDIDALIALSQETDKLDSNINKLIE